MSTTEAARAPGRRGLKVTAFAAMAAVTAALLLSQAALPAAAVPVTRYVRTTGSDTVPANNPCTNPAQPCKTITRANTVAVAGDTVDIGAGTYVERVTVTKSLTFLGAGAATTIVDSNNGTGGIGTATNPVFLVSGAAGTAVSISGLTLTRGKTGFGGGLEVLGGTVNLTDDVISANTATATAGGGGIGLFQSTSAVSLTATRVTVTGNTGVNGGGVYAAAPATFTDSTITANTATKQGGGVYLAKLTTQIPSLTITDTPTGGTTISNNTAGTTSSNQELGGGITATANTSIALGAKTSVTGNNATNGGGIYLAEGSTAVLDGTQVNSNKANGGAAVAGGNAGAIYNSGTLTIKNGAVLNANQAVPSTNTTNAIRGWGGAIFNVSFASGGNPVLTITASSITGGLPSGSFNAGTGGAIAQASPTAVNATGSHFTGNVGVTGGAIYTLTDVNLGTSNVDGNVAFNGGGLYAAAGTTTMTGGTLSTNYALNGGGAAVAGKANGTTQATLVLDGVTANGNEADGLNASSGNGGAIFNSGATTIRNHSSFSANFVKANGTSGAVTGYGGAVFNGPTGANDTPALTVTDSTINGGTLPSGVSVNAAGGGAIASTGNVFAASGAPTPGAITVTGSTFGSNLASAFGGAIFQGGSGTVSTSTFTGNGALDGGALLVGSTIATDTPTLTATGVDITSPTALTMFAGAGAAVLSHATLTMTDGSISAGTAALGGGLYVQEGGTATVDGTDLLNNTANSSNGGIGGAAFNSGSLTLKHSTVSGNRAVLGSTTGTGLGGAIFSGSSSSTPATVVLNVDADTLTGNTSSGGSAIVTLNGSSAGPANTTTITNSTVTGNSVTGTTSAGAIVAFHALSVDGSTITDNTAEAGSGGVYGASWSVAGSILTGNSGGSCGIVSGFVAPTDGGYNLSDPGDATCAFSAGAHDIAANPQLGALANNGGATQTRLPGPSSPAINVIPSGTAGVCVAGSVDQRGTSRPQGATCDIGAVEADLSAPTLTGSTTPTFVVGSAGSFGYTTTGVPTAHLSVTGALPSGVTFVDNHDGTATLAGTPAANTGGMYPLTITAANTVGSDATLDVVLTVNQAPTVSGPSGATYVALNPGAAVTFTTTGYPVPSLSETGVLPGGVTFVDNHDGTATLSGTAATPGTFPITVIATNGTAPDGTLAFTLTVNPAVAITTTALPAGQVGVAYSAALAATAGLPPYSWSVTSGSLPPGLSLAANGTISGTPTGVGSSTFEVTVQDSLTPHGSDSRSLSITIGKGPTTLFVPPVLLQLAPLNIIFGVARATLTDASGHGIGGQTIVFKSGATALCSAVTSADGTARCGFSALSVPIVLLGGGVTGTYAGNTQYLGSTGHGPLIG